MGTMARGILRAAVTLLAVGAVTHWVIPEAYAVPLTDTIEFNGHRYLLATQAGISWDQARAISANQSVTLSDRTVLKGHLLTITSQAEQDFISRTFMNRAFRHLWLGAYQFASDLEPAGNWAWITGEETGNINTEWSYKFLDPGQPGNDTNPIVIKSPELYNVEDALQMLINRGSGTPVGTLRDGWEDFNRGDSGGSVTRFVIEFDELGDNFLDLRALPALVSNSLWRSNDRSVPGWESVDFDDSGWLMARAPYPNPASPTSLMPGTNAQHMWYDPSRTSNGANGVTSAFFRRTFYVNQLPNSRPPVATALISVDDDYNLYVNGNLVFQNHDNGFAQVVDAVNFSTYLRNGKNVIAIQAVDGGWAAPRDRIFERVLFDATIQPQADLLIISGASVHGEDSDARRYDGRAGALIGHFGGGCNPQDMAYGPDQKLYIADTDHPNFGHCLANFAIGRFDGKTGEFRLSEDPYANFVGYTGGGRLNFGPGGVAFGPDGNLYVSDVAANTVLRYQGPFGTNPGQFIDTFVAPGSGGLTSPGRLRFGPDNNLYVISRPFAASSIIRYQGPLDSTPGTLIDVFVPAGRGGLQRASDFAFGRDKRLYVANLGPNQIVRYEAPGTSVAGGFVDIFATLGFFPNTLAFGPDWDLYVGGDQVGVRRFDARTGRFKQNFAFSHKPTKILFSAVPNYVARLGDFNRDGCVDRADLEIALADIRRRGTHDLAFDLNGDGAVDVADARKLVNLFTKPAGIACE